MYMLASSHKPITYPNNWVIINNLNFPGVPLPYQTLTLFDRNPLLLWCRLLFVHLNLFSLF